MHILKLTVGLLICTFLLLMIPGSSLAGTFSQKGWGQGWHASQYGFRCGFFCRAIARNNALKDATETASSLCADAGGTVSEVTDSQVECKRLAEAAICTARVTVDCTN